jgi:hypothetical protein
MCRAGLSEATCMAVIEEVVRRYPDQFSPYFLSLTLLFGPGWIPFLRICGQRSRAARVDAVLRGLQPALRHEAPILLVCRPRRGTHTNRPLTPVFRVPRVSRIRTQICLGAYPVPHPHDAAPVCRPPAPAGRTVRGNIAHSRGSIAAAAAAAAAAAGEWCGPAGAWRGFGAG